MKTISKSLMIAFSLAMLVSTAGAQELKIQDGSKILSQSRQMLDVPGQSYQVPEMRIKPRVGQALTVSPGQQGGAQALTILPGDRFPQPPAPKLGFQGELIYGYGMKVLWTSYGSPAQQAGLEGGDVITEINGRPIRSRYDYDQSLREAVRYSGGSVRLVVRDVRGGYGGRPYYTTVRAYLPIAFNSGPAYSQPRPAIRSAPVQSAPTQGASAGTSLKGDF